MQQTYYSLDTQLPAIGPVNELDRRTRAGLVELYRAAPPGVGYDDHWTQSQKFKEMVYVALRATMDAMAGSTVSVVCERKKRRAKTTFGKSFVAKSLAHSQDRDESFTPIDPEHPLARIVQCPNPHEKFSDIIEYVVMQNGLTGDAPVWGIPSAKFLGSGEWRPVELYALPRVLCQPQTAANIDYPRGYWRLMPYFPGGSGFWFGSMGSTGGILDAREVYRFKDKHPYITWAGWGKLAACGMMLDVLEGIDQSRWSAMQNGVTPDMVVTGAGFDAVEIERFDTELRRKNAGSRNSRKVLYLFSPNATPDTKAQVQWPSLGAREMDYTGSWEQATAAVLAAFRVPKGPAGLAVASSYGQLYAENKQWHTYGLQPLARRLAQFFSMMLAEPWCEWPGQYRVQIDVPELNDKDMEEKQKARWASTGTADYNEIRAADQLPPKPGGDVPVQVYVAQQQQKFAPDPMQALGMPGQQVGELGDPAPENKVSAPGGPPQPENKEGKGSLPPRIGGTMKAIGLWEYQCPHCGGKAYNGDPDTGMRYRGNGRCADCGETFSIVGLGLKPVNKAMSSLEGSTGGFLVKPPQMGRKARRKLRRFTRRLCKGFDESKVKRDKGKFSSKPGAGAEQDAHDTPRSMDDTGSYHPGADDASTIPGDYSPEEASHQLETLASQAADIPDFDPKQVLSAWGEAARGIGREALEGIGHHLQLLAEHGGRPDHVDAAVQSMGQFIGKVAKVGGRLALAVFKALRAFAESASKALGPFGWWIGSIVAGAAIVAAPVLAVQFGLIPLAAGLAAAPAAAMAGAVGARVVGGDMAGRSARKNWES